MVVWWRVAALQWGVKHDVPIVVMSESTAYDDKRYWWSELIKKKLLASVLPPSWAARRIELT